MGTNRKYVHDIAVSSVDDFLLVTNREIIDSHISKNYSSTKFYLEFYAEDKETVVEPTTGTVKFYVSPMGNVFLTPDSGATINAADVNLTTPSAYTPIHTTDIVDAVKIVFDSIDVATYVKILYVQDQ